MILDASGSEQLRGEAPLRLRHPSESHSPGRAVENSAVWQLESAHVGPRKRQQNVHSMV